MKKLFKQIFLVVCLSIVLVVPTTASAYSPVPKYETGTYKYFEFNPLITIYPNHCESLLNNLNNGLWYSNGNTTAWVGIDFAEVGTYRIQAFKEDDGRDQLVYDDKVTTQGLFSAGINLKESGNYRFVVWSDDSHMTAIHAYYVDIQ